MVIAGSAALACHRAGSEQGVLQGPKPAARMKSSMSWRHKPSLPGQLSAWPEDPFALLSLPSAGGGLLSWASLNPQVPPWHREAMA